ncbi:MAG: putative CDP-alcohol phosphatidyltransferase [Fluviicola sp.]|jgi:CDP-diacylglycerol--glycerol-3-phosphate 3-phosphatidyltransferase|uniref:CDP-alcohol phosphatidyltransferase family protein n=1 Tax=Fluviicola sp. TaxID=1917219 RepID=UPI002610BCC8|nr:CDP-alcohol phosphatidyltransferase family protein [Fluviicola sp.]MDF3028381.1 putative CDP-alcohol phosphatidyltransferase [Fluviicola sp.]
MGQEKNLWNVPNILSGYRILALPVLFYTLFSNNSHLFIILLSANLVSDILDGFIARRFNMQTEFGARLDSVADIGTYICAFTGMFYFHFGFIQEHVFEFSLMMAMYIIPQLISLIKFRRSASLHLYSNKITGYIQGIFIFTFFNFGNYPPYFYFMIVFSSLAYLEELVCVLYLDELRSNAKTLVHVLKSPNNAS